MRPATKPGNYSVTGATPEPLELKVPRECAGKRLDQALSHLLPEYSRSRLAHWIRARRVELDGRPALPKVKVDVTSVAANTAAPALAPAPVAARP